MRRNVTTGSTSGLSDVGKGDSTNSGPFGGAPEDPSATIVVNNWASFLAPVSTRRAYVGRHQQEAHRLV